MAAAVRAFPIPPMLSGSVSGIPDNEPPLLPKDNTMLNLQPVEKPDHNPRGFVQVFKIFPTIQGEGTYVGMPCIFIRLAGCNLQCPLCDTDYTSNRVRMSPPQVVSKCQEIIKAPRALVVITGGEPFRQNITPLVTQLLMTGYEVQIETNGTYYLKGFPWKRVTIACSPKTPKIHPDIPVDYYKYVLDAEHVDKDDGLPTSALGMDFRPARPRDQESTVFITPADEKDEEKNTKNLEAAVRSVMTFGYRLNLQVQKIIGME